MLNINKSEVLDIINHQTYLGLCLDYFATQKYNYACYMNLHVAICYPYRLLGRPRTFNRSVLSYSVQQGVCITLVEVTHHLLFYFTCKVIKPIHMAYEH